MESPQSLMYEMRNIRLPRLAEDSRFFPSKKNTFENEFSRLNGIDKWLTIIEGVVLISMMHEREPISSSFSANTIFRLTAIFGWQK